MRLSNWSIFTGFFSSFFNLSILLLAICVVPLTVLAAPKLQIGTPEWSVPTTISTDDGYADLEWSLPGEEFAEIYKITERKPGSKRESYLDRPSIKMFRFEPGRYDFRVAACRKNEEGFLVCGKNSSKLRLTVTEEIRTSMDQIVSQPSVEAFAAAVAGGPDQMRPGTWSVASKDGQGWSFYWANRLALPESDPLFGNAYDLVGNFYTYEGKHTFTDPEPGCDSCTVINWYRPILVTFRAIEVSSSVYGGTMYITRNGVEYAVGGAEVTFGIDNVSASIDWDISFKHEGLADVDSLSLLLGVDPASTNNSTHYGGFWGHATNTSYSLDDGIGNIAEVVTLSFFDSVGDPTWVQAVNFGAASSGSTYLCFRYLKLGYAPDQSPPGTWSASWSDSGCDGSQTASSSNANGRRYFSDFDTERFSADFTLPGSSFATGSVSIGTMTSQVYLDKRANFHGIDYNHIGGTSCTLTTSTPSCTAQVTWFTDSDYPNATAYAYNQTTSARTKILTSTEPTMENQNYAITGAGVYVFELRMGNSSSAELIAESGTFTVTGSGDPNSPIPPTTLQSVWDNQANYQFTISWHHTDTQTVERYELEETPPDGSGPSLYTVTPGTNFSKSFDKSSSTPGLYQYRVRACNIDGCSAYSDTLNWYIDDVSGIVVFEDDFESAKGWTTNLAGTDTANRGQWERENPQSTTYQLGTTVSGLYDLVTTGAAGYSNGSYDVDGGVTTITSPAFLVPPGGISTLSFHYYFGHSTASSDDFFRAYAKTASGDILLLEDLGTTSRRYPVWTETTIDLSTFAGQSIRLRFEAADNPSGDYVEAGVDDIEVLFFSDNEGEPDPDQPPKPADPPDMSPNANSSQVGSTAAQFRVDESGSATYSIPILTAPGSGGVAPQISLNYSSQSGAGLMGVGWSIGGLSVITRCAQTIEQDSNAQGEPPNDRSVTLTAKDRFCLDGQRLMLVDDMYGYGEHGAEYRTEIDGIARITSHGSSGIPSRTGPAYFKVERKDGSVSEYGNSGNSGIEARRTTTDTTIIFWAQNKFEDSAGNYINFLYHENGNGQGIGPVEFAIDRIEYTGNASTEPYAELFFEYKTFQQNEPRSDVTQSFLAGAEILQTKLLKEVHSRTISAQGSASKYLRNYELIYGIDGMGRQALESITECNSPSNSICFNPTTFAWLKSEHGFSSTETSWNNLLPDATHGLQLADVSGDGRPDLLYTEKSGGNYNLRVKEALSSGSFSSVWTTPYALSSDDNVPAPKVYPVDLNADGYQDVIYLEELNGVYSWVGRLSMGGSSLGSQFTLANGTYGPINSQLQFGATIMDVDGDGLSDVLTNYSTGATDTLKVFISAFEPKSDGSGAVGFNEPLTLSTGVNGLFPFEEGDWSRTTKPTEYRWPNIHQAVNSVFDFNGDGAVDLLLYMSREYERCLGGDCIEPLAVVANATNPVNSSVNSSIEIKNASFWILLESTGESSYGLREIVARGTDCEVADICGITGLPYTDYVFTTDINTDGLADFVYGAEDFNGSGGSEYNWKYKLNTGTKIDTNSIFTDELSIIDEPLADVESQVRIEDFNGDGYPDLLYPSDINESSATWMVVENYFGQGFALATSTGIPAGKVAHNDASMFVDFTGDGKRDYLFIDYDSNGEIDNVKFRKGKNLITGSIEVEPSNVITSVTNGFGAITKIEYQPLTSASVYSRMNDSTNAEWGKGSVVYDLIAPIYVVSKVEGSAPVFGDSAATSSVQYHYVGAKMQGGGRGFLGFGEVISYDPQSQIRTNTRYRQDFPFIGMPFDTMRARNASASKSGRLSSTSADTPPNWSEVFSSMYVPSPPGGNRISYAINKWATKITAGGAVFPYIDGSRERSYTLSGIFDRKVLTNSSYDTYGNLTSSTVRTYATDGTSAFATLSTSNTYYVADLTNWYLGRLKTTNVTHSRLGSGPAIIRKSEFEYESSTGILDKETIEPGDDNLEVVTTYGLDRFGNRTSSSVTGKNMSPRTSYVTYDSLGRFVIESKNALGQVTQKVNSWDVFGNPLISENIDGVDTTSAADLMGRPFVSYTETGVWNKTTNSTGPGTYCPTGTVFRTTVTGGGAPTKLQCFDQLGRVIRTAAKSFNGAYAYTDQYYDSSGRVERVSEPYFAGDSRYWNITFYDEVGRSLTQKLTSNNGTLVSGNGGSYQQDYTYDDSTPICGITPGPRSVIITNGRGLERVETRNALGETKSVFDDLCGEISYVYDAVGNLTSVERADNEPVYMTYDKAGRKTTMNDPDKGFWQYAYNPLGELTRQLDSKDQAIDFTYDKLSRITNRRELSSVTTLGQSNGYTTVNKETTSYKSSSYGKGQVDSITYRAGESGIILHKKAMTYDNFGRLDIVSTTIGSDIFAEQTTYDQNSRVFQQFDASGEDNGLRYFYKNGYVSMIKEARGSTDPQVYQDIKSMDARGNVTEMQLGNGVDVIADYGPASGRLEKLEAWDGANMIQDVEYLFDVLGNLKKRHDRSASLDLEEIFSYDNLNRLEDVNLSIDNTTFVTTLSLDYDKSGNITYKSDVGSYSYNGVQPHAVSRTSTGGGSPLIINYNYDANGNQTSGDGRTISYTVFDKPEVINKGGDQVVYKYGVGNSRYQREDYVDGGGSGGGLVLQKTTKYLGSVEKITEGSSTYYKRYLGGVAIATYYPSTGAQPLAYLLKDHIGSIHTVLNKDGDITARMHFSAFGRRQDLTDWQTPLTSFLYAPLNDMTTRGFTGHEQVDSMGVVHMNGRIYDPKLGRFLQADPFVQDPKNSQFLNRYTYALNNPLSYTDPSGYFLKELALFVAAVVRVVYAWEDPSAWVYLAVSAKNLFNATGSQQSGLPTGAVAGSFSSGFTTATNIDTGGIRNGAARASGDSSGGVIMATIGLTSSEETALNFVNGGGTSSFKYVQGDESPKLDKLALKVSAAGAISSVIPKGTLGLTSVTKEFRFYEWAANGRYVGGRYLTTWHLNLMAYGKYFTGVGAGLTLVTNAEGLIAGNNESLVTVGTLLYSTLFVHPVPGFFIAASLPYGEQGASLVVEGLIRGQDQSGFHRTSTRSEDLRRRLEESIMGWKN